MFTKLEILLPERTYVVETANLSITGPASIKLVPVIIGTLLLVLSSKRGNRRQKKIHHS